MYGLEGETMNNDFREYRGYCEQVYGDSLMHFGIKGMKWGIRRYQNPDGTLTPEGKERYSKDLLKNTKTVNMDKWGRNRNTNTLYVTGLSGSGKSTLAEYLANKNNAETINLDSYLSQMSEESAKQMRNKNFNRYLDKNVKDWRNVLNNDGKLDYHKVDAIAKASENYSKRLFDNNKKLIIEGVQLMDTTFYENRDFYKDKPYMLVNTSAIKSLLRGNERDEMKGLDSLYRVPYYMKNSQEVKKLMKDLNLK